MSPPASGVTPAEKRSYLDCNATAPLRPEARDAMLAVLGRTGNASSVHGEGRWARGLVEAARAEVADLVGARPGDIVFTSGGTEANGLALAATGRPRRIAGATEHPSVLAHASEIVPVDREGVVDLDALGRRLGGAATDSVLSVMLANNETGVLQPLEAIVGAARGTGALVHTDAVQAPGKIAVDFAALAVDLMTLSAHKLGGPAGVGALVVRDGLRVAPPFAGGGQERGRRSGTENLIGIVGFGAAARAARLAFDAETSRVARLRDRMETALRDAHPGVRIHGADAPRLPNTSCIGLPGRDAAIQVMALDLAGVAVSAGSACSSGKVARSHVLAAMGLDDADAGTAIRVSLGWATTEADIDRFIAAWRAMTAARAA